MAQTPTPIEIDPSAIRVIGEVVRRVIGKYGFTRQDRADLEQELLLNALVRLPKFDPELSTMPMFVRGVTINRLRNIIAARRAAFRGLPSGGSLNEMAEDEEGWFAERIDGISEDQYLRATGRASRPSHELRELHLDLQRAIESLPPDLQELCLRLLTHRVTEIARECGVSTATIYHRLKKIRREFAALGLEEYLR